MKAFISSTITDLREYRRVVQDVLRDLNIDFVMLDALLSRENLPSQSLPSPIGSRVLEELERSDLVVLILGHRYGSIDPASGLGWVEAEFRAARRINKPILAFLADDEALFPAALIDEDRSRVERFRQEVLSNYVVARFRSATDLAAKIAIALTHLMERSRDRAPEAKRNVSSKVGESRERSVRILHLLLSSPGDVADEREAASRAIFRFNQQEVENSGVFIKLVRWEDMAPQIGPGPQHVINEQIGEYDIFVGVMWNRFGTPTDIAASGTEEEFLAAVQSWRAKRRPWIVFYFCERPANFTNEQQLEQKSRVLRFRNELNTMGVVRTYSSVEDYENNLLQDLLKIVPRVCSKTPA